MAKLQVHIRYFFFFQSIIGLIHENNGKWRLRLKILICSKWASNLFKSFEFNTPMKAWSLNESTERPIRPIQINLGEFYKEFDVREVFNWWPKLKILSLVHYGS